jgi:protein-S-isoprenylcysteine O-methyltransferase Ste14
LLASAVVIGFALFTVWRVKHDHAARGRLTRSSIVLQFVMFALHGVASCSFLDSRMSEVDAASPLLALAVALMGVGLLATAAGMGRLSWGDTVGKSVTGLRTGRPYRFTRDPQLTAYFVFLAGYALFWPSWLGLAWLGRYGVIAHLMAVNEEAYHRKAFGREYQDYCQRTPRYFGVLRKGVSGTASVPSGLRPHLFGGTTMILGLEAPIANPVRSLYRSFFRISQ